MPLFIQLEGKEAAWIKCAVILQVIISALLVAVVFALLARPAEIYIDDEQITTLWRTLNGENQGNKEITPEEIREDNLGNEEINQEEKIR